MAGSAPSAGHWDAGKSSKKPRKQEGEETKRATGVITLPSASLQPNDDALQLGLPAAGAPPKTGAESPPFPVKPNPELPAAIDPTVSLVPTVQGTFA